MTDPYWEKLGITWCITNPQVNIIMPRLKSRLRRQSLFIMTGLAFGLILSIAGFLLGVFTIWRGCTTGAFNFIIRGIAILAISGLLSISWSQLLPVRASDYAKSLSEMIDLVIARSERMLILIRLGLYACAVAAILGSLGAIIRTHLTRQPALPPVVDLAVLLILGLGFFFFGRYTRGHLEKMKYLKQTLATDEV